MMLLTKEELLVVAGGGFWDTLMCWLDGLFHSDPGFFSDNGARINAPGGVTITVNCPPGTAPQLTATGGGASANVGTKIVPIGGGVGSVQVSCK